MAKYIKCRWIQTNPNGGVSMQGFTERREEVSEDLQGKQTRSIAKHETYITIKVTGNKQEFHNGSGVMLSAREFMVQDNPTNREQLVTRLGANQIVLEDVDLENRLMETSVDRSEKIIEAEVVEKMVSVVEEPRAGTALAKAKKKKEDAKTMKGVRAASKKTKEVEVVEG